MVFLHGRMVENIKDNILMIRSMVLENSFGQMEECTKDFGRMDNNMVKEYTEVVMVLKEKENGKMEKR